MSSLIGSDFIRVDRSRISLFFEVRSVASKMLERVGLALERQFHIHIQLVTRARESSAVIPAYRINVKLAEPRARMGVTWAW
jgi:hypothetical protein